jgi:hypothetical protein
MPDLDQIKQGEQGSDVAKCEPGRARAATPKPAQSTIAVRRRTIGRYPSQSALCYRSPLDTRE